MIARRWVLVAALLALVVGAPVAVGAVSAVGGSDAASGPVVAGTTYEPGSKPNIVFISADDMTLDELRYLPRVRELLGDAGVRFSNFTAPQPLCCPSRAQMLTGQYAQNNGVRSNAGPFGGYAQLRPETALPVWLQDADYQTAMVGKYLNGYHDSTAEANGREVGWDHWDPTIHGVYEYFGYTQYNDGDPIRPTEYHTDYVAQKSADLVADMADDGSPFFLWTSFVGPHGTYPVKDEDSGRFPPVVAPRHLGLYPGLTARSRLKPSFNEPDMSDKPPYLARRKRIPAKQMDFLQRARAQALAAVDEGVAAIVDSLRASGVASNTLIVFTSDNGYLLGEHRFQGKILAYDEAVRVPLLMSGLDLPAGVVSSQSAAMIDLAPTFAALAGATPLVEVDGRVIDARRGTDTDVADYRTLVVQAGASTLTKSTSGWLFRGVRTPRYTYISYEKNGFEELYDRRRDPFELRNMAHDPRYSAVRELLAARTLSLQDCAGEACGAPQALLPEPRPAEVGPRARSGASRLRQRPLQSRLPSSPRQPRQGR